MIKPGIWTLAQYRFWPEPLRRHAPVSFQLLAEAQARPDAVRLFEAVMRDLHLSSGICRTTFRDRFPAIDSETGRYLCRVFPAGAPLAVHDWAASDCLAAGQWAGALGRSFPKLEFHASDKMLHLALARARSGETVIAEPDGTPLQYISPPFVISFVHRDSPKWLVNRWVRRRAVLAAGRLQRVFPAEFAWMPNRPETLSLDGWTVEPIPLVHPEFLALLRSDHRIRLERHSVFEALTRPAHVIRTMNIFNRSYFDDKLLVEGYRAVRESLMEGGVWIVGGGDPEPGSPTVDSTLYRKLGGRLHPEFSLGKGYRAADLVATL